MDSVQCMEDTGLFIGRVGVMDAASLGLIETLFGGITDSIVEKI